MSVVEVAAIFLVIAVATATFAANSRLPWLRSVARLLSDRSGLSLPNGRFLSYGVIAGTLYGAAGACWLIVAPGQSKLGGLAFVALGAWRIVNGLRDSPRDLRDPVRRPAMDSTRMQPVMTSREDPISSGHQIQPDPLPTHPVAITLSQTLGGEELRIGNVVVETANGRLLRGNTIIWGWEPDALIVVQDPNDEFTLVPFGELRAISAKRLHPIRVALIGAALVLAGTFVGGYLATNYTQLELRDGRFLGFLAGAFLSPVVVWLLQDTPLLTRYRVVYPTVDTAGSGVKQALN